MRGGEHFRWQCHFLEVMRAEKNSFIRSESFCDRNYFIWLSFYNDYPLVDELQTRMCQKTKSSPCWRFCMPQEVKSWENLIFVNILIFLTLWKKNCHPLLWQWEDIEIQAVLKSRLDISILGPPNPWPPNSNEWVRSCEPTRKTGDSNPGSLEAREPWGLEILEAWRR